MSYEYQLVPREASMGDQSSSESITLVIDGKEVGMSYRVVTIFDFEYRIGKTKTGLIACDRKLLNTPAHHPYESVERKDIPLDLLRLPLFQKN